MDPHDAQVCLYCKERRRQEQDTSGSFDGLLDVMTRTGYIGVVIDPDEPVDIRAIVEGAMMAMWYHPRAYVAPSGGEYSEKGEQPPTIH